MKNQHWLPNFLGIGGQRCGSTWLYTNLRKHPDLWLPPVKELHYFDRSPNYHSPNTLSLERLRDRLFGQDKQARQFRDRARRALARTRWYHPWDLVWKLKFFSGRPNDAWYASLFKPGRHKVRGEITPAYAILNTQDVAHIHDLMPQAKIIFILRNPVQRCWSSVRMIQGRGEISEHEAHQRLFGWEVEERGDYLATLSKWESVFPPSQMFVEFFDEIVENPARLLTNVYEFLGVRSGPEFLWPSIREKCNETPHQRMPADVKLALTKKFEPLIARLSDRFGGHATKWLEDARATLDGRDGSTRAA
jgi:Sulfotransferase family